MPTQWSLRLRLSPPRTAYSIAIWPGAIGLSLARKQLSICSDGRSFLVSTRMSEHPGISFDDQQRRVGLPMITSMKTEFFFGFLIGFVAGVLLCVGIMFLIEPSHFL